jgi:hypothetical protein
MASPIIRYFKYDHLPTGPLRDTSAAICEVALALDETIPDGAEKSAGLRKLLEAKDCLVRAVL